MDRMKGESLITAASCGFLATASCAHAVSFTSDPIATINEQQKLDRDSHSITIGNQTYTWRGPALDFLRHDRTRPYRNRR